MAKEQNSSRAKTHRIRVERVQTGVRVEKRLVKVPKELELESLDPPRLRFDAADLFEGLSRCSVPTTNLNRRLTREQE